MRGQAFPVGADVDHLAWLDEVGRRDWLDRCEPVPSQANWWLHLLLLVDERWERRPVEVVAWVELTVWLLGQAGERSALGRDEVAQRLAYFVARMRGAQVRSAVLPSADAVVRECLDAIPVSLAQVAALTDRRDLHTLTRPQILQSRRARNLVNAAEQHLDDIEDPELADRLRAWLAIRPLLV